MVVGPAWRALSCGMSIAYEGGVTIAAFAARRERLSAIHCEVSVLLTFEARAGDLDVFMCMKLGANIRGT